MLHRMSDDVTGVHLVALSFPTRRSSDLAVPEAHIERESSERVGEGRISRREIKAARQAGHAEGITADRDRKSTRLNSSHLVISYAVFCLKKKKHTIVKHGSGAADQHR